MKFHVKHVFPSHQICKSCKLNKSYIDFEILGKRKLAKVCNECVANPPRIVKYRKPNVSRETSESTNPPKRKPDVSRETFKFKGRLCRHCFLIKSKNQFNTLHSRICIECLESKKQLKAVVEVHTTCVRCNDRRSRSEFKYIGAQVCMACFNAVEDEAKNAKEVEKDETLMRSFSDERVFSFGAYRIVDNRKAEAWRFGFT